MRIRKEFEMTEKQFLKITNACMPVAYMRLGGSFPTKSRQENANDAWEELGKELGFDYLTVEPVYEKGYRFFTAEVER